MSGRPGSNWPPIAWKAIALPNELLPLKSVVEDIIPVVTTHFTHFASPQGFEPWTTSLTAKCSTAELRRPLQITTNTNPITQEIKIRIKFLKTKS